MRVWAFPSFYPFEQPGHTFTGIFAHRQYKGLIENGAELKVIFPVRWRPAYPFSLLHPDWKKLQKTPYPKERIYDGVEVFQPRIANFKPNRFVKKTYQERYIDAITGFFKEKKIVLNPKTDIFYSQWLPSSAMVQIAAHRMGVKSAILSIGDDVVLWPESSETNMNLFRKTMLEADLRFSCASYLGNMANRLAGQDLPFDVVRWAVDHSFFKPPTPSEKVELRKIHNLPADKLVILCIGNALFRKGWLDLLDAIVEMKKVNSSFVLAAVHTGKPEFDFQKELSKRGISEFFRDFGEIPPRELNKIYNMADIFCLPSHSEGMANVVVEAMASGLPVLTTSVGGHAELVNNGVTGILIPSQQPGSIAEQLLALLDNARLRTGLGTAAREFILKDWGNSKESTVLLYKKLCSA